MHVPDYTYEFKFLSTQLQHNMVMEFNNCYHCPNVYIIARACKTNKPSNTALRGFGLPQAVFLSEALIDHVARERGDIPEKVHD